MPLPNPQQIESVNKNVIGVNSFVWSFKTLFFYSSFLEVSVGSLMIHLLSSPWENITLIAFCEIISFNIKNSLENFSNRLSWIIQRQFLKDLLMFLNSMPIFGFKLLTNLKSDFKKRTTKRKLKDDVLLEK